MEEVETAGERAVGEHAAGTAAARLYHDYQFIYCFRGTPEQITPISEMEDLIEERVGVKPGTSGSFYKLNPKVDDLPDNYSVRLDGIRLMMMGRIKRGGTGCYCPEGALLQALLSHLLVQRDEVVILDMEAGIEHLSRGTTKAVDKLIIVVEPGRLSLESAQTI